MQVQFLSPGSLARILPLALALSLPGCAAAPPGREAGGPPEGSGRTPAKEQGRSPAETAKPPIILPPTSPTLQVAQPDAPLEPPDGKWLVDDEGREYFASEVVRREGAYAWVGDGRQQVRLAYGLVFDVLSYDDQKFVVKIYRPLPRQAPPPSKDPTPAEREKILAGYRPEIGAADRLTLRPFDQGLPREGQWRNGFALADLDGDGHLDVVHGPARKSGSRPAIFRGDGRGNWQRWSAAKFPAVPFDYGDAAVADLDGDGRLDLALGSHLRGITALRQDGRGDFRLWSQGIEFGTGGEAAGPAFSSREIELVDWNRDGRIDLLALGEGPSLGGQRAGVNPGSRGVIVYLNQGDGTWVKRDGGAQAGTLYGDDLALGDLDGDGRLDFVTGSSTLGNRSLANLGGEDGSWRTLPVDAVRPQALVHGVAVADFDGDGRDDLALGHLSRELEVWRTGVDVIYSRPGNLWQRRTLASEESQDGVSALARGDLDGDGAVDLVALTGGGRGWVFLGDGKGGFVREESPEMVADGRGCRGYHVALADLDGDGADEVVGGFAGEGQDLFGQDRCPTGGSLRAWKAERRGRRSP
jgi:hypothetical protein